MYAMKRVAAAVAVAALTAAAAPAAVAQEGTTVHREGDRIVYRGDLAQDANARTRELLQAGGVRWLHISSGGGELGLGLDLGELVRDHALDVRVEGDQRPLPPAVELSAYRIMQEALSNTLRHADAGAFKVRLRTRRGMVALLVCDDGHGLPAEPRRNGLGLQGIHDRVLSLGGRLRLRSDARGTRLLVRFRT